MFLSMTGFGSNSHEFSWGKVSFELTSVNHKFQEFSARLPRELSSLENRIITLLRNSINRGKVRVTAEINWNPGAKIPLLDEEGLMNMFNQVRRISKKNHLSTPSDLTPFLVVPEIFDTSTNLAEQAAHEEPEIWDEIISGAIASLMEMKKTEGAKLKAKVDEDIDALEKILDTLKKRWEVAKSEAIESLRLRMQNVMEHYNLEIDENRIAQEVALMSDKWDVSEEFARMEVHIKNFKNLMSCKESNGKKAEFLLQEMLREVNTMGSKVNDSDFRWLIVEAKTCIERMREQIQNIE